jgi:hypothetical protein
VYQCILRSDARPDKGRARFVAERSAAVAKWRTRALKNRKCLLNRDLKLPVGVRQLPFGVANSPSHLWRVLTEADGVSWRLGSPIPHNLAVAPARHLEFFRFLDTLGLINRSRP